MPSSWFKSDPPDPSHLALDTEKAGGCTGQRHTEGEIWAEGDKLKLEGKNVARLGDKIRKCPDDPQPHLISEGEPSLRNGGLPVARVLAPTTHFNCKLLGPGAKHAEIGAPKTDGYPKAKHRLAKDKDGKNVPEYVTEVSPKMSIVERTAENEPPYAYTDRVMKTLDKIRETKPAGEKRLQSLEASGKSVTITNVDYKGDPFTDRDPRNSQRGDGIKNPPGTGNKTDVVIAFDPAFVKGPPDERKDTAWYKDTPPDVTLFHELNHADDLAHGQMEANAANNQGTNVGPRAGCKCAKHELKAAGLGPYATNGDKNNPNYPSENDYRNERVPKCETRTYY